MWHTAMPCEKSHATVYSWRGTGTFNRRLRTATNRPAGY